METRKLEQIYTGNTNLAKFQELFRKKILEINNEFDPSHRIDHFERVVNISIKLAETEKADLKIIVPSAWLHDLVPSQKITEKRMTASRNSAEAARGYLKEISYPSNYVDRITHCIHAHSFKAEVEPESIEAKILQDADRLDAIGAIGIMRSFACGGSLSRTLYNVDDPFYQTDRQLNDDEFILDHFFIKLLKLQNSMQTKAGKEEASHRIKFMEGFLNQLNKEIKICETLIFNSNRKK